MSMMIAKLKDGITDLRKAVIQILEKLDTIDEQNVISYNLMQDVLTALGQQPEEKKLSVADRMAKMREAKKAKAKNE